MTLLTDDELAALGDDVASLWQHTCHIYRATHYTDVDGSWSILVSTAPEVVPCSVGQARVARQERPGVESIVVVPILRLPRTYADLPEESRIDVLLPGNRRVLTATTRGRPQVRETCVTFFVQGQYAYGEYPGAVHH